jgi:lipopolysaccharide assembly protein A
VRYIYLTLMVVFAVVLLIFALSNMASATVSFLGWQLTGPLALMILAVYVLGMISGGSVLSFLRHSLHKATEKPGQRAVVAPAPPPS